jgi:prophage antirepressor-like protein
MNDLVNFTYENRVIRTVIKDGEPWWVSKDVAEALEYTWHRGLMNHVPEEWKGVNPVDSLGGVQNMQCLSEPGLYFFLGRSDKPKALPFQKWIAGEVVPSIRKTGYYADPSRDIALSGISSQMNRLESKLDALIKAVNTQKTGIVYRTLEAGLDQAIHDFYRNHVTPSSYLFSYRKLADVWGLFDYITGKIYKKRDFLARFHAIYPQHKEDKIKGVAIIIGLGLKDTRGVC